VVAEGQRGFRVAPISEADFDDVLTLRNKLEDEALRVSIALGDDAWEAAIVAALHRIRKLPPHWETTDALASEEQQRRHHMARRFDQAVEPLRAHNAWSNALIREALRLEPVE
jgi:GntR family transcriptional regulator, carbon starvation induced regulator